MSNSRHRLITSVFTVILAGATLTPAAAQTATTGSADRAVQIAQTRRANGALMHHFAWNSRVEVVINGQVKDTKIEQLSYDSSGQLQTLLLNDQKASSTYLPTPIGFLRKAIAEDKEKEMVAFLTGLKGMLGQYTLSTAGKILDFMTTATATGPNANGLLAAPATSVVATAAIRAKRFIFDSFFKTVELVKPIEVVVLHLHTQLLGGHCYFGK